jgi:hypothetical protein
MEKDDCEYSNTYRDSSNAYRTDLRVGYFEGYLGGRFMPRQLKKSFIVKNYFSERAVTPYYKNYPQQFCSYRWIRFVNLI